MGRGKTWCAGNAWLRQSFVLFLIGKTHLVHLIVWIFTKVEAKHATGVPGRERALVHAPRGYKWLKSQNWMGMYTTLPELVLREDGCNMLQSPKSTVLFCICVAGGVQGAWPLPGALSSTEIAVRNGNKIACPMSCVEIAEATCTVTIQALERLLRCCWPSKGPAQR